jgi:HK97 family phage prohead protease
MNLHTTAEFIGTKALDGMTEQRVFTFRASTSAVDRQGETIDQNGWQLDAYRRNPVILDSHRYGSIDDVLGRAVRIEPTEQGLEVDVEFAETERGQMARRMVDSGFLKTVSVGFRSLERRPASNGAPMAHVKSELLEVSMVAIPANRDAVRIRAAEQKAGRRVSKATAEKIREAVALLMQILNSDEMEAEAMPDQAPDEVTPKAITIEPDTLTALGRFARGGDNNG